LKEGGVYLSDDQLKATLEEFQNRKRKAEIFVIGAVVPFLLAFIFILAVEVPVLFGIFLVVAALMAIIGLIAFQRVQRDFKHNFLKDVLSEEITNGGFKPKKGFKRIQGLTPEEVYQTEFLKKADRFYSFDKLYGEVDEISFDSSDVKLQERVVRRRGKKRKVEYVTYFYGRVFHFDFNKNFDGYVQVLDKKKPPRSSGFGKSTSLFNIGSKPKPISSKPYEELEMESETFNDTFNTFATKQHTAFYILTPHFMEGLMKIEEKHPGKVFFSFIDNKLHFALHTGKATFGLPFLRKIDKSFIEDIKSDLHIIRDVVHELKLNRNIFKEE